MVRHGIFGHRYRFAAEGATVSWTCERCGALVGTKQSMSAAPAAQFARAPLIGLLPLRVWRAWRDRK